MSDPKATDYRIVQLIQREPPADVLRHAEMIPGPTGRYGKMIRYKMERTKTIYEVVQFKAGRPPKREEVLSDLRADLAELDRQTAEAQKSGAIGGLIDRALFAGQSLTELDRKRADIEETIAAVEENYKPGEAVPVP
ncbi:MAG: hypothetical protein HY291_16695 [Planctomycetes bacterium]|nr:hypothetical protein [Planctomycetota bacterium]